MKEVKRGPGRPKGTKSKTVAKTISTPIQELKNAMEEYDRIMKVKNKLEAQATKAKANLVKAASKI